MFRGRCNFRRNCSIILRKLNAQSQHARRIDPSLTTPDAIIGAVRSQPEAANALRSILSPRHPSQLYEAFFEGIVLFAILWFVRTRTRQPNGVLTGLFFICYAIFRIVSKISASPMPN
jgi:phosphatidylglycerol:prolipoprotein diacylglycerol transferase